MCFFHCPGSNGTTTCYCRETDNVANTRFLGHFCTPTMLHLRAFVANQGLSRIRTFLDVLSRLLLRHCGFYSDFVQISAQKIGRWDLWSRVERFVSRYIAKAIYCIIWKHQKISRYLKVSRYFYDIFNAGFWSILAFFWTCKQLQFDNLVVCEL